MRNSSHYILGLALGLVTITPVLGIGGFRLGYGLILVIALWRLVVIRVNVPRSAQLFLLWLIPLSYALLIDSYRIGEDGFSLFARGALALLGGFMLITDGQEPGALKRVLLGAAPIVAANAIVAIMQYFGSVDAVLLGMSVSGDEGMEAMREELDVGGLRASGLQGASHVFAYTMGVWAFLYSWIAVRTRISSVTDNIIWLVAMVVVAGVILSAQRSVVWLILPALFMLLFLRYRGISRMLVAGAAITFFIIIVGSAELLSDAGILRRLANLSGSTSGDIERQRTWYLAWLVIAEDPFLGSAFASYNFHRGIHNGFLNGWARYGVVWLLLVLIGLGTYLYAILAGRRHLLDQFAGCVLLALVLANAMFHTSGPAIGDMIVFVAFPFGLIYAGGSVPWSRDVNVQDK